MLKKNSPPFRLCSMKTGAQPITLSPAEQLAWMHLEKKKKTITQWVPGHDYLVWKGF